MASTYSPNLRLELIGTGDQQGTWGATTNTNLGTLLEEAIGGYTSVTVSDVADTTLTTNNGSADQSRNAVINLTGTISAARNVICPAIEKVYIVRNATTGGYAVTFKVSGQTGVSIPNGSTYLLYVNGTDAVAVTGTMAAQLASNVAITGGTIAGVTLSNATVSNVSVVANASSLGVRDSDGSHVLSIAAGSNLTSNITLTLTTGTSSRTLDISASNVTISTAGAALIDDADASAQRTTLGLGTIATQNSNNVSVTGGSVTGITDLAVADGGTGASDASTARTNLGIGTIGTQNADAVAITGGTIVANASGISIRDADASNVMTIAVGSNLTANTTLTLTTGASTNRTLDISATNVTISTAGAALIDDVDAAAQRTTLGLGTISTQNSNNVSITGGTVTGITDLALADGGTGASLSDPNADAVLGWNDTAGAMRFFTAGTGISIDPATNTISSTVTGGGDYIMRSYSSPATWTKPAGLKAVRVTVVGGGGGRGSTSSSQCGGAGGGGGAAIEYLGAPSIPGPVSVTVGSGGPATAPHGGGTSSFGAFCSATGGAGGAAANNPSSAGGAGGSGSGGTINFSGQAGQASYLTSSPGTPGLNYARVGSGGSSLLGIGSSQDDIGLYPGPGGMSGSKNSVAGINYGGGCSGAAGPAGVGAAGGDGIVIVEEFY